MCGRATLVTSVDDIAEIFGVDPGAVTGDLGLPRFNIAPTQGMAVVRERSPGHRELGVLRWGLVPWWSKTLAIGSRCINARAETVKRAPAFRDAFAERRCLVVIDGFFEWKTVGPKDRRPHHIRLAEGGPFALAGLWERWKSPEDGQVLETCTVVTTPSHGAIRELHDRMPLVLDAAARATWLGARSGAEDILAKASETQAARAAELVLMPVSKRVNDVRNDDRACLDPPDGVGDQVTIRF